VDESTIVSCPVQVDKEMNQPFNIFKLVAYSKTWCSVTIS
jgi:hypothetical protein